MTKTADTNIEKLFKAHYTSLYIYAYRMIGDAETCRDLVSDAFEYIWTHSERLDASTLKSYLYAYIRTRCIDLLRHQQAHERYVQFCMEVMHESSEADIEEADVRIARIRKVIRTLTPRTRFILEECYVRKKKYQEVADALEISLSGVRKHIVKALQLLREEFSDELELKELKDTSHLQKVSKEGV